MSSSTQLALYAVLLAIPFVVLAGRAFAKPKSPASAQATTSAKDDEPQTIMQPPRDDLEPPKDTPFTLAELSQYDGNEDGKPIYLAIKGMFYLFLSQW
jgi:membrane-associated progesterone receptor component